MGGTEIAFSNLNLVMILDLAAEKTGKLNHVRAFEDKIPNHKPACCFVLTGNNDVE